MDLYVWNGEPEMGVPSLDLQSLQMMAYIKFSGAPVTMHKITNPFSTPTGNLPFFKGPDGNIQDFPSLAACLRKHNYSCDYELSPRQCSEVVAYDSLLKEKLYPALIYLWWVEPKTYYDFTYKWFYKNIPFPFKFFYPKQFKKANEEFINTLYEDNNNDGWVETELHKHAQECLTMLSNKLGDKEYFFGTSPSTIDAIIFSYLVLLFKVNIKVSSLQNHIKACPNLVQYVNRILQRYFPSIARAAEQFERKKNGNEKKASTSNSEIFLDDVPNKKRNLLLSALVAAAAMCGYAFATGLVQVDGGDSGGIVEEDYDDFSDLHQGPEE